MGQLFLVQGDDAAAVARLFDRGLKLFRSIAGLDPCDVERGQRAAVARFPRLQGPTTPIQRDADGNWFTAAGTWVFRGAGPAASVGALSREALAGGRSLRDLVTDFDGLFVIMRHDARSGDVSVATDAIGRLHVYHAEREGCRLVSTSALVLAALTGAGFDPLGLWEFLGTGSVFETRSLHAGVSKIDRGLSVLIRGGRIAASERWFEPAEHLFDRSSSTGDVAALASALVDAVGATLRSHERPILDVTGGFDSRAVLAAARKGGSRFATVVNGADSDPDVIAANRIAQCFELDHRQLRPGVDFGTIDLARIRAALPLTDGEFDAVEYAGVMEIQQLLARQGGMTVNGSAGELSRGYWWDLAFPGVGRHVPLDWQRAARRFAQDDWADGMLAQRPAGRLVDHFAEVTQRTNAGLVGLPNTAHADHLYLVLRMQRWAGRLASSTDRIWPCATPLLFARPMIAALSAPVDLRRSNRMTREVIARLDPKLAALPMAGGYPASPIGLANFWRFAPLVLELGGKAWRRVRRKITGGAASRPGPSAARALWSAPGVAELLDPRSMVTAGLYYDQVLSGFLDASRADGFAELRKIGRVLTVELVARTLRDAAPL